MTGPGLCFLPVEFSDVTTKWPFPGWDDPVLALVREPPRVTGSHGLWVCPSVQAGTPRPNLSLYPNCNTFNSDTVSLGD